MKYDISTSIRYIGCDDPTLDLFEGKYPLTQGMAYNSYLILDERCAILDTMDIRCRAEWLDNLDTELRGRKPDYLIISHMEPDHAASIGALVERYPDLTIVGTAKTFAILPHYFALPDSTQHLTVADNDTLVLGSHTLRFITAPMVHWPEVMVCYEEQERVLFSADAFGKFGTLEHPSKWDDEARRYYYNIVGKYGTQVQSLLGKIGELPIDAICSLHGPILRENLGYYINKYDIWSRYAVENEGIVIVCGSIYGHTKQAAERLVELLHEQGEEHVVLLDITRHEPSAALAEVFRYGKAVFAASTYDGGIFTPVKALIEQLAEKGYRNRRVAIIENGSWAPMAGRRMRELFEQMRDISIAAGMVTLRGGIKPQDEAALRELAANISGL